MNLRSKLAIVKQVSEKKVGCYRMITIVKLSWKFLARLYNHKVVFASPQLGQRGNLWP